MMVSEQTNLGTRKASEQWTSENTPRHFTPPNLDLRVSRIRQKRLNDPLDNIAAAGLNGD